jgi:hypothetical protein
MEAGKREQSASSLFKEFKTEIICVREKMWAALDWLKLASGEGFGWSLG